jgi:hypothetical protein
VTERAVEGRRRRKIRTSLFRSHFLYANRLDRPIRSLGLCKMLATSTHEHSCRLTRCVLSLAWRTLAGEGV